MQSSTPPQLATARTELVPRKIQAIDAETVAGQKRAEEIQVLFARRVAMSGNHADAARAARFVPEHGDRVALGGDAKKLNLAHQLSIRAVPSA